MNKSIKTNSLFLLLAVVITFIIYSCGEDTVTNNNNNTPEAGTISGTITYYDTNRIYSGGYYDISAYASWPPSGPPTASANISLTKSGNQYTGTYKITGLTSGGVYVLAASWIKLPYAPGSVFVSGLRGCDTTASCFFVNPKRDTLPSDQGLSGINFNADLDTAKMQIRF